VKYLSALIFTFLVNLCLAQNLVPNASFEAMNHLPTDAPDFSSNLDHWFSPNLSEPFACHVDAIDLNPNWASPNPNRYQQPRTGKAMAIYTTISYRNAIVEFVNEREYVSVKIKRTIPKRAKVYAEFWISWHGYDCCRTESVSFPGGQHGMWFSPTQPFENSRGLLAARPQINLDSLVTDTVNWLKVSGTFISEADYDYLTIGNFYPDRQSPYILPVYGWELLGGGSPYFVDDVKVRILNPRVPDTIRVCRGDTAQLIATGEENHAWAKANNSSFILGTDSVFKFRALENTLVNFYGSFDTLQTYVAVEDFSFDLGENISICSQDTFSLQNPVPSADTSWWAHTGQFASSIKISQTGWYKLTAVKDGCTKSDSIFIYASKPSDYEIEEPEPVCLGRDLKLTMQREPRAPYRWSEISVDSTLTVSNDGWYWVEIDHPCGKYRDSIEVVFERCVCKFFLANSFTPNGDGLNDVFKPVTKCNFESYDFQIANRWGQVVFKTKDPDQAWDGGNAPAGMYIIRIVYSGLNEEGNFVEDEVHQTLHLLR